MNHTNSYGETTFRLPKRNNFENSFLEVLDYQDFDARISIQGISIETSTTEVGLSIEFSLEELNPVVSAAKFEL